MPANGTGPIPASSMIRTPLSGPVAPVTGTAPRSSMRPSPRWSAASASAWGELVTARLPGVGDQGPRPDLLHVREAGVRPVDLRLDLCLQRRVRREDFQRDGRVDMMLPPVGLKSLGIE